MWPFGTAQKITQQISEGDQQRRAEQQDRVDRLDVGEAEAGAGRCWRRRALSIVGTKMLAAMKRRTTTSIAKEKRFCSTQPRHSTW